MSDTWQAVPGAPGIFRAQYNVPGTSPFSTLVDLGDNTYLVYSPGPGLEDSLPEFIDSDSKLLLLAPCRAHTLGIAPWSAAHPDAEVYAPQEMHKLLKPGLSSNLYSIGELAAQLPDFVQVHVPPPNKFHEVWLRVQKQDITYWIVGDAFLNFETVEGNFLMKFLLGVYGIKPGLRLHKLFRFGLQDKFKFRHWAEPLFTNQGRQILLPCHREIYDADDCGARLAQIVKDVV